MAARSSARIDGDGKGRESMVVCDEVDGRRGGRRDDLEGYAERRRRPSRADTEKFACVVSITPKPFNASTPHPPSSPLPQLQCIPGGQNHQFAAVQHALHDVPAKQYVPCPQQLGPPAKAGERVRCCWPHRVPSTPLPYHHDAGFWHVLHEVPSKQY